MVVSFMQYTHLAPPYINIPNVYAVNDMLAHPISSHWYLDNGCLQMSSELTERLRVNIVWFVLPSDVSCGTKGDNKVGTDLGLVKASKGENAVEVAVSTAETGINAVCEDAIHVLSTKPPKEDKKVDVATAQEDFYRNFRTKCAAVFLYSCHDWFVFLLYSLLMSWVLSNVDDYSVFRFIKDGLWCTLHLGVFGCRNSVRSSPLSLHLHTLTRSAKTSGADHTANGYLIFMLYSVALLALHHLTSLRSCPWCLLPLLQLFAL